MFDLFAHWGTGWRETLDLDGSGGAHRIVYRRADRLAALVVHAGDEIVVPARVWRILRIWWLVRGIVVARRRTAGPRVNASGVRGSTGVVWCRRVVA
jgi:hypothetical protein